MKLLKNLGLFLLAVLSFFFGYGLVQSLTTLYRPVRSLCLWSLQVVSDRKG